MCCSLLSNVMLFLYLLSLKHTKKRARARRVHSPDKRCMSLNAFVELAVCFPCGSTTCLWNRNKNSVTCDNASSFCSKCAHKLVECQWDVCSMSVGDMIISNYGFVVSNWVSQSVVYCNLHAWYFCNLNKSFTTVYTIEVFRFICKKNS